MSKNTMLGVFGGVLIALSVLITDSGIAFDADAFASSTALVLLIAGLGVILALIFGKRVWALYFAIAATTIAVIAIIDVLKAEGSGINIGFIVLVAGVVLALLATVGTRSRS